MSLSNPNPNPADFLMKHSLHFATKLNSRDIDEKCNNYCFGYPSMI